MTYAVLTTQTAMQTIREIDAGARKQVLRKIEGLQLDPDKQGKALTHELAGFRSISAAGRYRVVYRVEFKQVVVYVHGAGIRKDGDKKDVYTRIKKLLKAGLLDID